MEMKKVKEDIVEGLKPQKKFRLSWVEENHYCIDVEASSEEKARQMFYDGEVEIDSSRDIIDGNMCDDSLEVDEVEDG